MEGAISPDAKTTLNKGFKQYWPIELVSFLYVGRFSGNQNHDMPYILMTSLTSCDGFDEITLDNIRSNGTDDLILSVPAEDEQTQTSQNGRILLILMHGSVPEPACTQKTTFATY